jgi:hypothetical protein
MVTARANLQASPIKKVLRRGNMPTTEDRYKGLVVPYNSADKIGAMIETAKNKFMGTGMGSVVRGIGEAGIGAMATPYAAAIDTASNIVKAVPKVGLGAIGAVTGLEPPKTPDYNYSATGKTMDMASSGMSDIGKGLGAIGQGFKQGLIGVGFKEPRTIDITPSPKIAAQEGSKMGGSGNIVTTETAVLSASAPQQTSNVSSSRGGAPSVEQVSAMLDKSEYLAGDTSGGKRAYTYGPGTQPLGAVGIPSGSSEIQGSGYNPKDLDLQTLMKDLSDTVSNGKPSVERLTKIKALQNAIGVIAPMTSQGAFGVAGMHDITTKRGQDISAGTAARGQDVSMRGQDIAAETAAAGHELTARGQDITANTSAMNALYQTGMLEHGREQIGIEKMKLDSKNPDNFLKMATLVSPKIKTIDPITGEEKETHDLSAGVKMLTDSGFETPKGFKQPGATQRPSITAAQAKAELERRKGAK